MLIGKVKKIVFGFLILLLSAAGGFALAGTYAPNEYYYIWGEYCLKIEVDKDCEQGENGCMEIIGSGAGKQLYLTRVSQSECATPLKLVE